MKKLLIALVVFLSACGSTNAELGILQTQVAVQAADKATLGAALERVAIDMAVPTETPVPTNTPTDTPIPEPTATPTEKVVCANYEYIERLQYGFITDDDELGYGKKPNKVTVERGTCVLFSIFFEDGSYVSGQLSEDGKSVVYCEFHAKSKPNVTWDCNLGFNHDPADDSKIGMDGRVLRDLNSTKKALLCLATDPKEYTPVCRNNAP